MTINDMIYNKKPVPSTVSEPIPFLANGVGIRIMQDMYLIVIELRLALISLPGMKNEGAACIVAHLGRN